MFMGDNVHMEIQEDEEDDDMDFNPLLRGETLSEASSSLSSENEGPCDDTVKHIQISLDEKMGTPSSECLEKIECYSQECVNEDEEIIMQYDVASRKSTKQLQLPTCTESCIKGISAEKGSDDVGIPTMKDMIDVDSYQENKNAHAVDADGGGDNNDDAICMRTRARHSLADYTLEELETFLQESDDDDDLHNVDDEEEYHKFLAAVLLEGDGDVQVGQEAIPFDEDEENDADFEIELEEALESDIEETSGCNTAHQTKELVEIRIPETRQKKRLKETANRKKFIPGQSKTSLRPILPSMSNSQRPPFPSFAWQMPSTNHFSHCSTSVPGADLINGFTPYQVGQLYCLIHEHVQLLLQIFSVSVLDPSRQLVANDLQKLISEMIERHEMALSWRRIPYPLHCFRSPNLHNSLQVDSNQISSYWAPVIDNPILSILDLAPLRLAKHFMADVAETASRYKLSFLEDGLLKNHSSKEPLFSLPSSASQNNEANEVLGGSMDVSPSSSGQQPPKKSLAATLVESTMKKSVALVPAGIAKLAQRFFHLFNAALFPHKPPTLAVANRVLFTDAEDGLLAMGIMEHNNDWLAIQQHFLPCKSKHQIFVRQKNRSSSKAPENPIKAVRRMKGSPLTEDEKALISEGLRIFKHDWLSVWKYFVPHRDPSMLPRQWRIATGTQKSYKKTEAVKEKRRIYEARRRRMKACLTDTQTSEKEVNDGDGSDSDLDCGDEAYVHEAFLEDPEPGSSKNLFQNVRLSSTNGNNAQAFRPMQYKNNGNDSGEAQVATGNANILLNSSNQPKDVHSLHQFSQIRYGASYSISSNHLSSCSISGTSGGHFVTQSYRARKRKGLRVVKLAPDLPPVNLPPSVRVISQSAFKIYHGKSLHSNVHNNVLKNHALEAPCVSEAGVSGMSNIESTRKLQEYHSSNPHSDVGSLASHAKENASEFDAQLHPLLFQNPLHFSFNCQSTAPSSYDFFLGSHCSVSTVSIAAHENSRGELGPPISSTIDFHPLLQRPENSSDEPAIVNSQPSQLQYGQANDLDLNIHPSSVDTQRTDEVCDHQNVELNAYTPVKGVERIVQGSSRPFDLEDEELEASRGTNLVVQSTTFYSRDGFDLEAASRSHDISCHKYTQDLREESNPGIVMEQEELSDSEDESENVVFEHEDLEDSEDDESFGVSIKGHNKVPGFGGKEEEAQAPRDLQLHQSSSASTASVKRRKGFRDATPQSPALPRAKLTRSKNENCGTKRDRLSRSSNRSRKRAGDESSMPQDLGVRAVESKVAGSRRSKRRSPLD